MFLNTRVSVSVGFFFFRFKVTIFASLRSRDTAGGHLSLLLSIFLTRSDGQVDQKGKWMFCNDY